jgi:D-alanyl-D-alanine carboxypeptidase/D-alanyl-D-alanine-endopeptidase (penicillin-binding protein 4)
VESWDPTDLNEWFAAPVGALNFNENVVTLRIEPGEADGLAPRVHTLPRDEGLPVVNEAETGWGRVFVQRDHPRDPIRIVGSIPRGGRDAWRRLTVRDPARFTAQAFRRALEEEGIRVGGEARGLTVPRGSTITERRLWAPALDSTAPRILAVHRSPPLLDILTVVNKESHNLLAETTLKTLGRMVEGAGTFEAGGRAVERFLTEVVGVAQGEVEVVDGSGLSTLNRASPGVFVAVVDHMAGSGHWEAFRATLPEAGDRRELGRMYRTPAAGNLRAKTGTIEGVSSLSGIVSSASGERIAFSILGNGLPSSWAAKRNVEDRIGVRLAGFRRTTPAPPDASEPNGSSSGPQAPGPQRAVAADGAPPERLDPTSRPGPRRR